MLPWRHHKRTHISLWTTGSGPLSWEHPSESFRFVNMDCHRRLIIGVDVFMKFKDSVLNILLRFVRSQRKISTKNCPFLQPSLQTENSIALGANPRWSTCKRHRSDTEVSDCWTEGSILAIDERCFIWVECDRRMLIRRWCDTLEKRTPDD